MEARGVDVVVTPIIPSPNPSGQSRRKSAAVSWVPYFPSARVPRRRERAAAEDDRKG